MEYRSLGRTNLKVSSLCLGTMTWVEQNDQAQAFAQIDRAKTAGINFIDTAEMYPVPPRPETYATTEQYIGNYFQSRGDRADWIIATKIAGPGNGITHIRDGQPKFNRGQIRTALDNSLRRLQTDWIDLYQLHWPERSTNFVRAAGLPTSRWRLHSTGRNSRSARCRSQSGQNPPHRPVQRNTLGRDEIPAISRSSRLAAFGFDTEPL